MGSTPIASVLSSDTWRPLAATAGATFTGVATDLQYFKKETLTHSENEGKMRKKKNVGHFFPVVVSREKVWSAFFPEF